MSISIPFVVPREMIVGGRVNWIRITEALIIYGITAVGTIYGMAKYSEARITAIDQSLQDLRSDVREMRQVLLMHDRK